VVSALPNKLCYQRPIDSFTAKDFTLKCMQEFCNGGSVRGLLSKGVFSQPDMRNAWGTIMHAAKGIASGMQYVHGKRICHGDLNPSNILLKVWCLLYGMCMLCMQLSGCFSSEEESFDANLQLVGTPIDLFYTN
jgi:tRNA A-37 threonylcarbamoyl transferase component Bud32